MSNYNPSIHHRRSIRMKGYDYSQAGLYFITICCQDRICLFGEIKNGIMCLNDAGTMIHEQWLKLAERFINIQLHEFVVMPNHFHGIVGAPLVGAHHVDAHHVDVHHVDVHRHNPETGHPQGVPLHSLGDIIGAFKSITTLEYIRGVKNDHWQPFNKKMWQRNYWEHIIRNYESYERISDYIKTNPAKWDDDMLR